MSDPRPIGIFDSGLGGLTVLRAVAERLPVERLVYLGDTARVPYGTKSAATVSRYAVQCASFLRDRDIKALVVACNTASALAMDALRAFLGEHGVPVLGVIEPGAVEACRVSRSGRVGVVGTASTIRSGAYARTIAAIRPDFTVIGAACPLLVPLAEEGWTDPGDAVVLGAAMRRSTRSSSDARTTHCFAASSRPPSRSSSRIAASRWWTRARPWRTISPGRSSDWTSKRRPACRGPPPPSTT